MFSLAILPHLIYHILIRQPTNQGGIIVKFTESDVIHRPVEAVFSFATDPQKSHLWQTENVVAEKSLAADPQGKARSVKTVKGLGFKTDFTMEAATIEPEQKVTTDITGGGSLGHLSGSGRWLFDGVPDGTRVTFAWEVELSGLLRLATPIIAPLARCTLRRDLVNLKRVMEISATTPGEMAFSPRNPTPALPSGKTPLERVSEKSTRLRSLPRPCSSEGGGLGRGLHACRW